MRRMFEFGVFTSVVTRKRVSLVLRTIFNRTAHDRNDLSFHVYLPPRNHFSFPFIFIYNIYIYVSVFQSKLLVVTQLLRASTVVVSYKNETRLIIINIMHLLLSRGF